MLIKEMRLLCRLQAVNENIGLIKVEQFDMTPVYAYCRLADLEMCMSDPRCRFVRVAVNERFCGRALISWNLQCACMDLCPGDIFMVPEASLY